MTEVIARVHPVHLMNVDWAPGGRQYSDQASRLGLWVRRNNIIIIIIIIIKGIYIAQVRKGHKCAKIAAKKWHEIYTLSLHATSRKYHMAYRFVPFITTLDDLKGVDLPNANGFSDINWVFVERRRRFLAKLQSSVFRGFSFYFMISFLTLAIVFVCLFHCYAMHYVMLPVWRNNVYICATFRTVSTVTARRAVPRR